METDGPYEMLTCERKDGIATVTINRPELHNAFNEHVIQELDACFGKLAADESVRAIVLTGSGKSFCAGADINWMKKMAGYTRDENVADSKKLAGMLETLDNCPKPIVGRINGAAIGGGCGLVAVCDIAVASTRAKFGFSEVKLGIIPATISPFVLKKIGQGRARELFLTGERFTAEKAKEIGLVHEVAKPETLDEVIARKVKLLLSSGPCAIAHCKELLREIPQLRRDELNRYTAEMLANRRGSPEGKEGLSAFLEKRKPSWKIE